MFAKEKKLWCRCFLQHVFCSKIYTFFLKFNNADRYVALLQTSILYDDFIDLGMCYTSKKWERRGLSPLTKYFTNLSQPPRWHLLCRCISPTRLFRAVIIWNPLMDVLLDHAGSYVLRLLHKALGHSLAPGLLLCHRRGEFASRIRSFISRLLGEQPSL